MNSSIQAKFLKFCFVGGSGALLNFGITYGLTEWFGLWYMLSLFIATGIAMVWNFTFNHYWTWGAEKKHDDPDYDWYAYYHGNPIQKYWKQTLAQKIARMAEGRVALDIGCGSSPLCTVLQQEHYLGFDADAGKIEFMHSQNIEGAKFGCQTIDQLCFDVDNRPQKRVFDTVICSEVIEHFATHIEAMRLLRLLNKMSYEGGAVIVATPNYDSRLWRGIEALYKRLMPQAYGDGHIQGFNEKNLIELASLVGLKHEKTDSVLGADLICKFRKVCEVD